jgi:hypothetical protein
MFLSASEECGMVMLEVAADALEEERMKGKEAGEKDAKPHEEKKKKSKHKKKKKTKKTQRHVLAERIEVLNNWEHRKALYTTLCKFSLFFAVVAAYFAGNCPWSKNKLVLLILPYRNRS